MTKKLNILDLTSQSFRLTKILHPIQPVVEEGKEVKSVYIDAWIEIVGTDSDHFFEASKAMWKAQRDREAAKIEHEVGQLALEQWELAGKCIVGWDQDVFGPFSTEEAIALMGKHSSTWLRVQVENAMAERSNFYKK